ncbi:MAG: hypothetical protein JEZ08_23145 [Clostridiales bacterium]|nr:hypothetical protein [Clostridiales bacterium]
MDYSTDCVLTATAQQGRFTLQHKPPFRLKVAHVTVSRIINSDTFCDSQTDSDMWG